MFASFPAFTLGHPRNGSQLVARAFEEVLQRRRRQLLARRLLRGTESGVCLVVFAFHYPLQWSAVRVTPSGNPRDLNFSRTVAGIAK